jgi:hypothetical protein
MTVSADKDGVDFEQIQLESRFLGRIHRPVASRVLF